MLDKQRIDFIKKHSYEVIKACEGTAIFPSVKMAQMIIEASDSKGNEGQGITALKANNYFGIKADANWKGEKMQFNTPKDGKKINYFRVYANALDSIKDHTNFLLQNKRYTTNGVFTAKTPAEQLNALQKAGYSESPTYAKALLKIITDYNLTSLDKFKSTGAQSKENNNTNTALYSIIGLIGISALIYYSK